MLHRHVLPYALVFFAGSALLAGCATTTVAPMSLSATGQARAANALLYVAEPGSGAVGMYSYPGLKFKAALTGLKYPVGLCVDPNTQDVWVVDGAARQMVEFKHGATRPLRELKIDAYYPILNACAVNPKNGDLAVTSEIFGSDAGALLVYKKPYGKAKFYNGVMFFYNFVGYDANGDAFVDGNGDYQFVLAELAYGSKKLQVVTPPGLRIHIAGGVQYDGSGLAVGNARHGIIYQIAGGTVTGKITLENACRVGQFFIDDTQVIVPTTCGHNGSVLIYNYPAGGAPVEELHGLRSPTAVAISR